MTDTHCYDGKIVNQLDYSSLSGLTLEEKKAHCESLLQYQWSPTAGIYLQRVLAAMGTPANYDPTNNLNADDLLCLTVAKCSEQDFRQEMDIQLADMVTGDCPQGRTHRLYQLLLAFKNE